MTNGSDSESARWPWHAFSISIDEMISFRALPLLAVLLGLTLAYSGQPADAQNVTPADIGPILLSIAGVPAPATGCPQMGLPAGPQAG